MAADVPSTTRLLTYKRKAAEVGIPIPLAHWNYAEDVRQKALQAPEAFYAEWSFADESKFPNVSGLVLCCQLLKVVLGDLSPQRPSHNTTVAFPSFSSPPSDALEHSNSFANDFDGVSALHVLKAVVKHIERRFLRNTNIHSLISQLEEEAQTSILRVFFDSNNLLMENCLDEDEGVLSEVVCGAIFSHPKVSLVGLFGGQGSGPEYFDEFANLVSCYRPIVTPLLSLVAAALERSARSPEAAALDFAAEGLSFMLWLDNPSLRPTQQYLLSAPISMPLICLIQLCHYWVSWRLGCGPNTDFRSHFQAFAGHSQGIVSAFVASSSTTPTAFFESAQKACVFLFWMGLRCQACYPPMTMNPKVLEDSLTHQEGSPTPMLSIRNLPTETVVKHVDAINKLLSKDFRIDVALINGPRFTILSGPPQSLQGLVASLRKLKVASTVDQSRIPHSQRKLTFSTAYLPVTVPFHSSYLASVTPLLKEDMRRLNITFPKASLLTPVKQMDCPDEDMTEHISKCICELPQNWVKCTDFDLVTPSPTHFVDFGPGQGAGIGSLTAVNKEGRGVQMISAGSLAGSRDRMMPKSALFHLDAKHVSFAPNWKTDFAPSLCKRACDGRVFVDTRFSRLLGKPPVMVAGMTPTTVSHEFVAACTVAGYHVELAGGGHYNETMLRNRISELMKLLPPGEGITVNVLFLNAHQWGFQYPLLQKLRSEGFPIEGICIAAGVPSLDNANEIVQNITQSGIRHVAFKPGSIETILRVVQIAAANPSTPIILQWTGGRAGGHHSFEDFHAPILATYAKIRRQSNIVLVAGSGIGDADHSFQYLTGEWSEKFQAAAMPFDGVLLGSRMMVAKEAKGSLSVKKCIVEAPGIEDEAEWERTYKSVAGGITTVISELGEPIHKVATRAVLLWKELDETIFSLPKAKQLPALRERKQELIKRLNADYNRVWFGKKQSGDPTELEMMTYEEVARRCVELMYVAHQSRWTDKSFQITVYDWLTRVEERFVGKEKESIIPDVSCLDADPSSTLDRVFAAYPLAKTSLLTTEDMLFFLNLCQLRGRKPVPFIPVLDEKFSVWFKKDSLWQSEDIDAVPDQDPQRVCILQGPVAVRFAKSVDESAKDILDGVHDGYVRLLRAKGIVPTEVAYIGGERAPITVAKGATVQESTATQTLISVSTTVLPSLSDWVSFLPGSNRSWLSALLQTPAVVLGGSGRVMPNPIPRLCRPRASQTILLKGPRTNPSRCLFFGQSSSLDESKAQLDISFDSSASVIEIRVMETPDGLSKATLVLRYRFNPAQGYAPIHEILTDKDTRVKAFYRQLWCGVETDSKVDFNTPFTITREEIVKFSRVVGNQAQCFVDLRRAKLTAPMDFGIVIAWKSIAACLLSDSSTGDLLRLVHLSNSFRMLGDRMFTEGDIVSTTASVTAILATPTGKEVHVTATLSVGEKKWMEIRSKFFYRGEVARDPFREVVEKPMELLLKDKRDVAVLLSKDWISWEQGSRKYQKPGIRLVVKTQTEEHQDPSSPQFFRRLRTVGVIETETSTKETVLVGRILSDVSAKNIKGNPVLDYLRRVGKEISLESTDPVASAIVPDEAMSISCPLTNVPYSKVSSDRNPIHSNPYFADLAGLPTTITHGMWTSAACRRFVEVFAAENQPDRVRFYEAHFTDFVAPGDALQVKLFVTGMRNGRRCIRLECTNQGGQVVLRGTAEVEQPLTAYVFTGQGSQEVGMGMDLYASSEVAKAIWDRADAHFLAQYGISILNIVRNNPKELTVYFGGKNGRKIRRHYMTMTFEEDLEDGSGTVTRRLFPDIDEDTDSYTFRSPSGLLSATQFTQPALTLMEKAAFENMKSKGMVQSGCIFAGHSLGEYSALACFGDVLPLESLVDVVFYRGITMQLAVQRDEKGRSDFAMCAVNPLRVGKGFGERPLLFVVSRIAAISGKLLEIVNYNVENWQYVVAGTRGNLATLSKTLDFYFTEKYDIENLLKTLPLATVQEKVEEIIRKMLQEVDALKAANQGYVPLTRGNSTIPLDGIDVPFHSRYLYSGVAQFRRYLHKKILPTYVNVSLLTSRYIPNVCAEPFKLQREYIEKVQAVTGSPVLERLLQRWDAEEPPTTAAGQQKLGYALLIELLAYQFASPVRWSETMDVFFMKSNVDQLVEVGPAPILANMANRTLKMKYVASDEATNKSRSVVLFKDLFNQAEADTPAVSAPPASAAPAIAPAAPPIAVAMPPPSPPGSAVSIPYDVEAVVRTLVAVKTKKPFDEVQSSKSIRELSAGKSTMQNEVIGDLAKEFGSLSVDKPEDMPISELSRAIMASKSPAGLGPQTNSMLSKFVAQKFPAGASLSTARSYFTSNYRVDNPDRLCLHMLVMEGAGRCPNEADLQRYLDDVAKSFSSAYRIPLAKQSAGAGPATTMEMMSGPPTGGAPSYPDSDPLPSDFIRAAVARKLKLPVAAVDLKKSLRELSGGKSTLQNELVGDLQKEFGASGSELNPEAPLGEMGNSIRGYQQFGPAAKALISKFASDKFPAGFSLASARSHLQEKGFGPKRQDAILLYGAAASDSQPRFASPAALTQYLDTVASGYTQIHGLTALASSSHRPQLQMSVVHDPAATSKLRELAQRQLEALAKYLDLDLNSARKGKDAFATQLSELATKMELIQSELGEKFVDGIIPIFSPLKVRTYDSQWNWVRQDLLQLYYSIVFGETTSRTREVARKAAHAINRASEQSAQLMAHYVLACADPKHEHHKVYELGRDLLIAIKESVDDFPVYIEYVAPTCPSIKFTENGDVVFEEIPRPGVRRISDYVKEMKRKHWTPSKTDQPLHRTQRKRLLRKLCSIPPYLHLKSKSEHGRQFDLRLTNLYFSAAEEIAAQGLSLDSKTVLLTGCGKGSIGAEVLRGLLAAGAKVIATTSNFSTTTTTFFRNIYESSAGKGAVLVLVPFNQGSVKDLDALLDYIYAPESEKGNSGKGGLGWDLDFFLPFAAISEGGREIEDIDATSELAHRLMLTNVHRLIGGIKVRKAKLGRNSRPCHIILPLSPNHGTIGADGLYGESKLALETLFERWHSEAWADYCTVLGAVIGWTRGTGLMAANNVVAHGMEQMGVRTFSTTEMAFNILVLLHSKIAQLSESQPVWADFDGGLGSLPNLHQVIRKIRSSTSEQSNIKKAIIQEHSLAQKLLPKPVSSPTKTVKPRAQLRFGFPELTPWNRISHLQPLREVLNLNKVVVVTGYGEVGPLGNSRTRWEMEAYGEFSLEGCIEMAWLMGLIRFETQGERRGWVDNSTGEVVPDFAIKERFEAKILKHSGVRLIEPELVHGYDPSKKMFLQQVAIDFDLQPIEVSEEEANAFRRRHGDLVDIFPSSETSDRWMVTLKRGAVIHIPKALQFDRTVAGLIPTGWDARRYGIPDDIINQVDPVTLFVLVSTVEALVASGITDPYEFYRYVHITEVGQTSGGGVGGMRASADMYRERFLDNPKVASDVLQETFINTMPAWVNLLLLSSSGHILTPVGACATAVESVEAGVSAIETGAAKIVLVGGYDDFSEEGSYEFASMKATSSGRDEAAKGREPKEMSRPASSSRSGFMEAQGAGIQVLMSAALALEMGVPIYGIIALTSMATDREGRSVPAPGIGLVGTAREVPLAGPNPLLDVEFRRRQVRIQRKMLKSWAEEELQHGTDFNFVMDQLQKQEDRLLDHWGNDFYRNNPNISPLRGALAVFGLTVDDIGVASFHGTGTKANDYNESKVLQAQLTHLGRATGNILPSIFQKHLTGHPKGAAAAWMLTGMLQCLNSGLIPGNRNADNIDPEFAKFEHIYYPSKSLRVTTGAAGGSLGRGLKAGLLKSFGFGQVNGEILVVHPDFILGALSEAEHKEYAQKRRLREEKAFRFCHDAITTPATRPWFQAKNRAPYADDDHQKVALDPTSRASYNEATQQWEIKVKEKGDVAESIRHGLAAVPTAGVRGVGVDVEEVDSFSIDNDTFLKRNFTNREQEYCWSQASPKASFTARWCAKEAVVKALSSAAGVNGKLDGAAAPLIEIEVVNQPTGAPTITLSGQAEKLAKSGSITEVKISLTHSATFASAVAVAL